MPVIIGKILLPLASILAGASKDAEISPMIARKNLNLPAIVILGSVLAGALYAWFVGEDINWDWRNYHEYGAFALLNSRFGIDVAPAGIQTFLNPLVYVPAYLLRHGVGAPLWGILLGAVHGLNLALVWWVSRLLLGASASAWSVLAAVVIAAFGPMTLSETGTSFSDILTALPVIAGFGLILSAGEQRAPRLVIGALLIGAAAGLKLTNAAFLIGAGVSVLLAADPIRKMGAFAIAGAAGGLATGGAWAWRLWAQFGNPLFPFYNSIFRSPEAPLAPNADLRFMPHNLLDAAAYPFYWLAGDHPSLELPFRDPRFVLVTVLFAATWIAGLIRKLDIFQLRDKQFMWFFAVSYGLWMYAFSIQRYIVVLELIAAPLIVLLLLRLAQVMCGTAEARAPLIANRAALVVAVMIAIWSRSPDWGRRPWSDPYQPQLSAALSAPATYLMLQKPTGYIAPLLSAGSRSYQLSDIVMPVVPGGIFDQRIRWGLAHPLPGGVWALYLKGSPPREDLLTIYGLALDTSRACEEIPGADLDIEACPVVNKSTVSAENP